MEKKEIRPGDTLTVAGIRLTPVIRIHAFSDYRKNISGFASKEPLAVIAESSGGKRLFRITGEEITAGEFSAEFGDILI